MPNGDNYQHRIHPDGPAIHIRSLGSLRPFAEGDRCPGRSGISSAHWSQFDHIVFSDVRHGREHAAQIVTLIDGHADRDAGALIGDRGRGHGARLTRAPADRGFEVDAQRLRIGDRHVSPLRGRGLRDRRGEAVPAAPPETRQ